MAIGLDVDRKMGPACEVRGRIVSALIATALSVLFALFAIPFAGCQSSEADDPLLRERVVSIDADALASFLEQTARLTGTPAAHHARSLLDRSPSCGELWAHVAPPNLEPDRSPGFDLSGLDCRDASVEASELAALVRERRGKADGFVSWPVGEEGRVELRLDIDPQGGLEIEGILIPPSEPGLFSLLVPGSEPLPAPVVTPASTLVHLRMRPASGIRLSNLIPAGSQADRLFALKGRLLEGALLTGTWELAFMPPAPGGEIPLAIGALHHRMTGALEDALDEALAQLEATWPIR